ncbi:twin-arginine translocation signal domain-containing protein [Marinifilum fragile]|uniref:twin-arginine translocation signal domain-containing protein n=1 Tax=Marinifilum fragile TaxID=570161 RepID=UPI0012FB0383|nr:twin-arginine translocation signal domain-containing protein [Marinifilum fragile]
MNKSYEQSRRKFIRNAAAAGIIGAVGFNSLFTSCNNSKQREYDFPPMLPTALMVHF